jgi:hypothetical protein
VSHSSRGFQQIRYRFRIHGDFQPRCGFPTRCKRSGMRNWQYGNAEAVLALRAARQDGEFSALWSAHLHQAP